MTESHTSQNIKDVLQQILLEWEIPVEKVTACVSDNASNIVSALRELFGFNKHQRCFAHTLNLATRNALDELPEINNILKKVKEIVTFFKQSVNAANELKKCQLRAGKIK